MPALAATIIWLNEYKARHPEADKARIQEAVTREFDLGTSRSLVVGSGFAMRFSAASGATFSNTVLGLSTLKTIDDAPVVVCVVRPAQLVFLLANATFLSKISHSSAELRVDNIRGSFNGSDIIRKYDDIPNQPDHFEDLFAIHTGYTWEENVERLVAATQEIKGTDRRFSPSELERSQVLRAPQRAMQVMTDGEFRQVAADLDLFTQAASHTILDLARIENVNLRGNAIEALFEGTSASHALCDIVRPLRAGPLGVDIKTKLALRPSAPKAYNVDKMLQFHAHPGSVFGFLFIYIDVPGATVATKLVPVLDALLLKTTVVRHHWAGRISRGVAQLSGSFEQVMRADYEPIVDEQSAGAFLRMLLDS